MRVLRDRVGAVVRSSGTASIRATMAHETGAMVLGRVGRSAASKVRNGARAGSVSGASTVCTVIAPFSTRERDAITPADPFNVRIDPCQYKGRDANAGCTARPPD